MRKQKRFESVRFDSAILRQAFELFLGLRGGDDGLIDAAVSHDDGARLSYDHIEEFYADYRRFPNHVELMHVGDSKGFHFHTEGPRAFLRVELPSRADVEQVFGIFEEATALSAVEPLIAPTQLPKIFIGHGGSADWRDLRDHLMDQHHLDVVAYESGARAGHTIRDILEELILEATFALLVFTGEDEQADGQLRARQNVVHEAGLFQGKLGFPRAVILLEDGVEHLSNLDGVQYIRFARGNIRETFGDVIATIRREFFI